MKEKPIMLMTVLGLLLWSAITATTLYSTSATGIGSGPLNKLSEWYRCLWPGSTCSIGTTGNLTAHSAPWFLPAFIFFLSSSANTLWIVMGYTVFRIHRRIEIDESVYAAAMLVFLPPLMPVVALFEQLFRPSQAPKGKVMEA